MSLGILSVLLGLAAPAAPSPEACFCDLPVTVFRTRTTRSALVCCPVGSQLIPPGLTYFKDVIFAFLCKAGLSPQSLRLPVAPYL